MSERYMETAVKMGKASATGGFHLFIGKIISTIIYGIGSILVGMFIDPVDYGLYTIALVPVATFILFQDWGIGSSLTKYCANYRAEKREKELRSIIVSGLTFMATTGIVLTLLSLLTTNLVASIFGYPESAFLLTIVSFTILSNAILNCSLNVFVGFERMELITVTMIVAATVQGMLSPLLVYLGFGAVGAVVGFTVASVISSVASLALLYFSIFRRLPLGNMKKPKMFQTLKPLLVYGVPLSIAAIIGGITSQIILFVMASSTDIAMIASFGIATGFTIFLTFFTLPIKTVLFPAFSKLDPLRDRHILKTVFASSVKYSSLFMVPAIVAIMVLSTPLISTIYADKWVSAPFFLTILIMNELVVLLGTLSCSRLLTAIGETKLLMKLNLLSLCIGAPTAFLVIPPLGILGVVITTTVTGIPSLIIGLYWTWKHYEAKADLYNSAKIFLAAAITGVITYMFLTLANTASWILLIAGATVFLVVYILSISLVGAVNQMDIDNLRVMFSELGLISKLLRILLTLIEKTIKVKDKRSNVQDSQRP